MTIETLTPWLRYVLIALGVIYFVTESTLFSFTRRAIRNLVPKFARPALYLMYCPPCLGFWIGCTLGALHLWPADDGTRWAILESGLAAMALGAVWSTHYSNSGYVYDTEMKEQKDDALSETQTADDEDRHE